MSRLLYCSYKANNDTPCADESCVNGNFVQCHWFAGGKCKFFAIVPYPFIDKTKLVGDTPPKEFMLILKANGVWLHKPFVIPDETIEQFVSRCLLMQEQMIDDAPMLWAEAIQ